MANSTDLKLIAIMGPTGSGKSQFVNVASGSNLRVGHQLASCTQDIQSSKFILDGVEVALVDTPGFDDSERPQADVLKQIATFLEQSYEGERKINGMIFTHRISDTRMGGRAVENFRLFRKICGDDAMKNCVIATNMWASSEATAIELERERALGSHFFKDALALGATMKRHHNTTESAHAILRSLLKIEPNVLQIQDEMVEKQMVIPDTQAGVELDEELERLEAQLQKDLEELRRENEPSHEYELTQMQERRTELERKVHSVQREKEKLKQGVTADLRDRIAGLWKGKGGSADLPQPARPTDHLGGSHDDTPADTLPSESARTSDDQQSLPANSLSDTAASNDQPSNGSHGGGGLGAGIGSANIPPSGGEKPPIAPSCGPSTEEKPDLNLPVSPDDDHKSSICCCIVM